MNETGTFQIGDIARADFRTTFAADMENSNLQKLAGFHFRYQPARLAIALSLRDSREPSVPPDINGRPIRGDTLFGTDETDLVSWISTIVEHSADEAISRRRFQELVAAHWARGTERLSAMLEGRAMEIEDAVAALLKDVVAQDSPSSL